MHTANAHTYTYTIHTTCTKAHAHTHARTHTQVHRVHYGLLTQRQIQGGGGVCPVSRRLLAVPFLALEQPSPAADFAHHDVAINSTILAYRFMGLRDIDITHIVMAMKDKLLQESGKMEKRPAFRQWKDWQTRAIAVMLASDPTKSREEYSVIPLDAFEMTNEDQFEMLHELFKFFKPVVRYFLRQHVFPQAMRGQRVKLNTSGQVALLRFVHSIFRFWSRAFLNGIH